MERKTLPMLMTVLAIVALSTISILYACELCEDNDLCREDDVMCDPNNRTGPEYRNSGSYFAWCLEDPWGGPNCDDWETIIECNVSFACFYWCDMCIAVSETYAWNCSTD